jgi:hypothetical protein
MAPVHLPHFVALQGKGGKEREEGGGHNGPERVNRMVDGEESLGAS